MPVQGSRPYQPVARLQTVRSTSRSVTKHLEGSTEVSEARYWSEKFGLGNTYSKASGKFAHPRAITLQPGSAAIVHQIIIGPTAFSTNDKNARQTLLAAICGPRVPLYGTTSQSTYHRLLGQHSKIEGAPIVESDRQIPTGGQLAISGALRADGRLLAIGTENGVVRVADTTTRATLCQFTTSSTLPIRSVHWFRDGQHILTTGDDGMMRIWNVKQIQQPIIECIGHGDSVRTADLWQMPTYSQQQQKSWPCQSIAATGSYDHTIRLWNVEHLDSGKDSNDRLLSVLEHGAPVEAIKWLKSENPSVPIWLVSAGETNIKVWNPLTGNCVFTLQAQHRKTITSLLLIPRTNQETNVVRMRLVTAGLDGLLRIHSWDSEKGQMKFLHGINMNGDVKGGVAITALATTYAGDRIAIGTASGTIMVRQIGPSFTSRKRLREPRAGTYAFFTRGMNADPDPGDYIAGGVLSGKKRKLAKYDLALKQFRYGDALDEALLTRDPNIVIAVLEELGKRNGLYIALSNRDEETLEPILAFTARYVCGNRPQYSSILIGITNILLDIYSNVIGQSETIDELFNKLKNQINDEIQTHKLLFRIVGQIDAILSNNE